jgi:hypothetical protein
MLAGTSGKALNGLRDLTGDFGWQEQPGPGAVLTRSGVSPLELQQDSVASVTSWILAKADAEA